MKIQLYLDEDAMEGGLVWALRSRKVDVTTALEQGMINQPDELHLECATALGRTLYSFNVGDYLALHTDYLTQGKHHAGVILAPQQTYSVGEQMRRLVKLMTLRSAEAMQDQVEFLSAWR
jgi:hypothetical protein